jgi:hypothetical protein
MNKTQRKQLAKIVDAFKENRDELNGFLGDEQDKMANMPDNLQGSERYSKMEEDCCGLEDALMSLDEVIDQLEALSNG